MERMKRIDSDFLSLSWSSNTSETLLIEAILPWPAGIPPDLLKPFNLPEPPHTICILELPPAYLNIFAS